MRTAAGIVPNITVTRAAGRPVHRQICDGFRAAVVEGRLQPGQRLPSTRALAAALGVSRLPVLNAFDQLLAEGYFESRAGSGTFVSALLPAEPRPVPSSLRTPAGARPVARRPDVLLGRAPEPWLAGFGAFRMSEPALDHFPFAAWSRLVGRHARPARSRSWNYTAPMGDPALRETLASYLRAVRGVRCDAAQIMIVSGSQQGLEIAARVLVDPGAKVWIEEPGYGGARDALAMAGARLVPVPVDDEGLDVAAGIRTARGARAAVVTPSHQYPLGATMTASRRLQLLDWAQAAGAWIVEDDYDSEYRYDTQPVAALQGLDRDGRVVYVGTFSKVLFPGLRVGYLVIPADLVPRFAAVRDAMDICPPQLTSAALADFIAEGHFARHLRRTSALYRARRSVLVDGLRALGPRWRVAGAEAGMHLVALGERADDRAIALRAAALGIRAMPLSSCHAATPVRRGLVLGYGGVAAADIPRALALLKKAIG